MRCGSNCSPKGEYRGSRRRRSGEIFRCTVKLIPLNHRRKRILRSSVVLRRPSGFIRTVPAIEGGPATLRPALAPRDQARRISVDDTSLPGLRVVREFDTVIAIRGRPAMIVSDNGTEFTSIAMLRWSQEHQVEWHYIAPGKPTQNAFVESLQRPPPRRVVERDAVRLSRARTRGSVALERRLQHSQAAQRPRQPHASRLRQKQRSRRATGRDAALH